MTPEELLQKAKDFNEKKEYNKVIDLLPENLLRKLKKADLYAEKAQAYFRLRKIELCYEATEQALALNPKNVKAIHYKGNMYLDSGENRKAKEFFLKAIKIDPEYPNPYNGLGIVHSDLKDYETALDYYKKAIELDPKYSFPYNGMGVVYKEQNKYDKAIECYQKAFEISPNDSYPYNNIANVYRDQKEFDKAIEYYKKATEINETFVLPYNGLGNVYMEQGNYPKAIEFFKKAINVKPKYVIPYFNMGHAYYKLKDYNKALKCFEEYKSRTKAAPDYYTRQSESAISELNKIIKNKELIEIGSLINEIKKHLLVKEDCITHYTSLSVSKILVLDKESNFRLSEGAFLNDTSEGRELFKFLKYNYSTEKEIELDAIPFSQKPFIGSFISGNKHNDLTMWRMYGKENNEEAKGCSITIKTDKFVKSLKSKMIPEKDSATTTISGEEFSFYKVAYRRNIEHDQFFINDVDDTELKKFNILMEELAKKVKVYNSKERKLYEKQNLIERLNEIAYLFKTSEYQHENEIRLVINGVGFDKKVDTSFDPTRVYIELVSVKPLIRRITLGPKVEKADEWAAAFFYSLDKENYELEDNLQPEISISRLPFK